MATPSAVPEVIAITDIKVIDRARKDMGDIPSMINSIREFGLIQPIVIGDDNVLIAGGRRLAALRAMGVTDLVHAEHWVRRDESDATEEGKLRMRSMELEENLRRKDMEWPEVVAAKAKLMDIMTRLKGAQRTGGWTREEMRSGETEGFGVRKLAAMLGESPATVSNDLQLAQMVKVMPHLAKVETKSAAMRGGMLNVVVAAIQQRQAATPKVAGSKNYALFEGEFQANIANVPDASVDLVYTDLPYGVDLQKMQNHATGVAVYQDDRQAIVAALDSVAVETFRVLKEESFCVFWFGFNYYTELRSALEKAGFKVNPVPIIWLKHRNSTEAPLYLYANGYEQAMVARKGNAKFIRPGQVNIVDIPAVSSAARVQIAQQPVELVERFILDMTLPTATILDLCAGSGTTGVAALKNNRKAILFEKDPQQCVLIRGRMDNAG